MGRNEPDIDNVRTYVVSFGTTLNIFLTTTFLVIVDGSLKRYAIWASLLVIFFLSRCGSWAPLDEPVKCVSYVWWVWCTNSLFWTKTDTLTGVGIVMHTAFALVTALSIWYIDNANVQLPEPIEALPWRQSFTLLTLLVLLALPLSDNLLGENAPGVNLIRIFFFGSTCIFDILLRVARKEMPAPWLFVGDKMWLLFVMRWCLPLAGVQWMSIAVQLSYLYSNHAPEHAPATSSVELGAMQRCDAPKECTPQFTLRRNGGRSVVRLASPTSAPIGTVAETARLVALSRDVQPII